MIDVGATALAAMAYWLGWYRLGFWIIALALSHGVFMLVMSIIAPQMLRAEATEASPASTYRNVVLLKAASTVLLLIAGAVLGRAAGYF